MEALSDGVRRVCRRLVAPSDVDDCTQDVLLRLLGRLANGAVIADPPAYLGTVARRVCKWHRDEARQRPEFLDPSALDCVSWEPKSNWHAHRTAIEAAAARLPLRDAPVLHALLASQSFSEAAREIGIERRHVQRSYLRIVVEFRLRLLTRFFDAPPALGM